MLPTHVGNRALYYAKYCTGLLKPHLRIHHQLLLGGGIVIVLERSRCPRCKKYFKAKKLNEEFVEEGKIYHRNDKTYQKNLYRKDYVCMNCEHEWSKNVRREEEV